MGTFVGDATDEHVGDFVLVGREGHVGVYVDVGFVEGVIDSSAVGGLVGVAVGVTVGVTVGVAVGDGVVGRGYGDLVAPKEMNLFCILL